MSLDQKAAVCSVQLNFSPYLSKMNDQSWVRYCRALWAVLLGLLSRLSCLFAACSGETRFIHLYSFSLFFLYSKMM